MTAKREITFKLLIQSMVLGLLITVSCDAAVSRAENFVKSNILKQKTR
jgi:hypothetical protein